MSLTKTNFSWKTIPLIALFLSINGLFVLKYVSRTSFHPVLLLALFCIFTSIILFSFPYFVKTLDKKKTNISIGLLCVFVTAGILLLHYFINPYELNIDRWSAIHSVIHNLFDGIYPYSAQTHLGGYGSPFPVWQLFHIPFYIVGNIALAMLFSFFILVFTLVRYLDDKKSALFYIVLLAISPAFWYETAVRSDLFYNFLLVFIVSVVIHKKKYKIDENPVLLGIICGLFLSTRLTVVIPFFMFFLSDFISSMWKNKITFLLSIFASFTASFLPLIFWDSETFIFFEFNPFVLQSRQGSILEFILIVPLSVFLAIRWKKDFIKLNAYTAYSMIILVVVVFLHRMITSNFANHLFSSAYDISYFNMALPFLIFSIVYSFIDTTENSKI